MLTKSKLVIAAALIFGAASAAQAGNDKDDQSGGFVWGPMGQMMGGSAVNPAYHRSLGGKRGGFHAYDFSSDYAYVQSTPYRHHWDYWDWR
jgi:hypothetical protein